MTNHTASTAWECMQSIPLNPQHAQNFTQYLQDYIPFMSLLGWLKSPPASYQKPAVDVLSQLQNISTQIGSSGSGSLTSQLDFEWALRFLSFNTGDFHSTFVGSALSTTFVFALSLNFVSLSLDGSSLPKVYVYGKLSLFVPFRASG